MIQVDHVLQTYDQSKPGKRFVAKFVPLLIVLLSIFLCFPTSAITCSELSNCTGGSGTYNDPFIFPKGASTILINWPYCWLKDRWGLNPNPFLGGYEWIAYMDPNANGDYFTQLHYTCYPCCDGTINFYSRVYIPPPPPPPVYTLIFDYDDTQCRRTTLIGWIKNWTSGPFEYSIKIYQNNLLKFSNVFQDSGVDEGFSYVYVAPPGNYRVDISVVYNGQTFGGSYDFAVTNTNCVDSNITPIMTYPTYGPTWTPSYPTHGPTAVPTRFIPIGTGTLPVPVPTGTWVPNPNATPIFPIRDIINLTAPFEDLPDNLTYLWSPPSRDDLLNMVNSTIIPDSTLNAVFDMWDTILAPFLTGVGFILALFSIPLNLLTYINLYIIQFTQGMFSTLFAVLRPAVFFMIWIFSVIPDPLMWLGMCALGLVVLAKVLNS